MRKCMDHPPRRNKMDVTERIKNSKCMDHPPRRYKMDVTERIKYG